MLRVTYPCWTVFHWKLVPSSKKLVSPKEASLDSATCVTNFATIKRPQSSCFFEAAVPKHDICRKQPSSWSSSTKRALPISGDMPESTTAHDVFEPLQQALWASGDVMLTRQMFSSRLFWSFLIMWRMRALREGEHDGWAKIEIAKKCWRDVLLLVRGLASFRYLLSRCSLVSSLCVCVSVCPMCVSPKSNHRYVAHTTPVILSPSKNFLSENRCRTPPKSLLKSGFWEAFQDASKKRGVAWPLGAHEMDICVIFPL